MADVFVGGVSVRSKAPRLIECGGVLAANCLCEQSAEFTAHAINSHDELVQQRDELIAAAKAVIERWDSPLWKNQQPTAELIHVLRKAVANAEGEA